MDHVGELLLELGDGRLHVGVLPLLLLCELRQGGTEAFYLPRSADLCDERPVPVQMWEQQASGADVAAAAHLTPVGLLPVHPPFQRLSRPKKSDEIHPGPLWGFAAVGGVGVGVLGF